MFGAVFANAVAQLQDDRPPNYDCRRVFVSIFLFAVVFGWLPLAKPATVGAAKKPNIVIIVADDLGWADVGYHSDRIPTPHLDRIAREGVELDHFYVFPMCSPTRAGLMTGRYPIRFGMARAVIPPWRHFGLDPSEVTLPEALAKVMTGRWVTSTAAFLANGTWATTTRNGTRTARVSRIFTAITTGRSIIST